MINYNYPVEKIIGEVVDACKDTGAITITESSTLGTYDCVISSHNLLYNNHYITISGTTNFDGTHLIDNVTDTTFTIVLTTGLASETGTYIADFPYYTFEKWTGLKNKLQDLTSNIESQPKRFPRLFFLMDFAEDFKTENYFIATGLKLFFVLNTEQNKEAEWRLDNTLNYLEKFYRLFYKNLKLSQYIKPLENQIEHTKYKRYYNFTQQTKQNVINHLVDVIELNIPSIGINVENECN